MSTRQRIVPGDLVLHNKIMFEAALVQRYGIVVGVQHSRFGHHFNCEKRINIFFASDPHFDDVCDCEVIMASELP